MKSIEKPAEYLSFKEKEILKLCQEIILWGTDEANIKSTHALELKVEATKLYEDLSGIDFDNNDKYYQFYERYSKLMEKFNEIKDIDEDEYIEIGDKMNIKKLIEDAERIFQKGKDIIISKDWETDQEEYGDYIGIHLEHNKNKIEMHLTEMHDGFVYEKCLIDQIISIFKDLKLEYSYKKHRHSSTAEEYKIKHENNDFGSIKVLLSKIFETIGNTKRIPRK